MPNKSSPHGGFITEGSVIHGTLRTQDLLRAFGTELQRVFPFNGSGLAFDCREAANALDYEPDGQVAQMTANDVLQDAFAQLNDVAQREGLFFGAHEGDGSDFGYWKLETEED